jgi:hypothetical protein
MTNSALEISGVDQSMPESLIAIGFDEPGGVTVLTRIAQGLDFPVAEWWAVNHSALGGVDLPVCQSLQVLRASIWPSDIPRPDVIEVDRLLANPTWYLLVAGMMFERYRHTAESSDAAASFTQTLTQSARVLAFWMQHLQRLAPAVVLFSRVPHDFSDYLAYHACKRLGIRVLLLRALQVGSSSVLLEGFEEPGLGIPDNSSTGSRSETPQWLESEIDFRRRFESPDYMANRSLSGIRKATTRLAQGLTFRRGSVGGASKSIRSGPVRMRNSVTVADGGLLLADWAQRTIAGRLATRDFANLVDRDRAMVEARMAFGDFVYLPLHLQPEATTSPLAALLLDQRLLIEAAAMAAEPMGLAVVVKENPKQIQHFRGKSFWQDISAIKGVLVASDDADTFALIAASRAVVTINGTAGWEAQFHGRGAAVHASAFYGACAGAFMFERLSDLESCLTQAISYSEKQTRGSITEVRSFLNSFSKIAIESPALNTEESSSIASPPPEADLIALGDVVVARIRGLITREEGRNRQ